MEGLAVKFAPTNVEGAFVIELDPIVDERGFFARAWCAEVWRSHGLDPRIAQINTAHNSQRRTLRGMHVQLTPHAEVKVVHCPYGAVYDVVVDLRPESKTFRGWHGVELTQENHLALYIPEGCAHGYLTLEDNSGLTYLTSCAYARSSATGVRYDDPAFGIVWPHSPLLVSAADRNWPDFQQTLQKN